MIRLEDFVLLFESGGFTTYFNNSEDCIKFYNMNTDMFSKYGIDDKIIKKLYDMLDGEIPITIDTTNKKIKLRRMFQDRPELLEKLGEFSESKNTFKFNNAAKAVDIGDGGLSSRAKSGKNTEPQELLFCDVVNSNESLDIEKTLLKYELDKSFEDSVKYQIDKLKKYLMTNSLSDYSAYRPSNSNSSINKKFNKILDNKKVFHNEKKSYITPADVFVYKKSELSNIEHIFDDLLDSFKKLKDNKYDTEFELCKQKFVDLLKNKTFVPVSLKKITKSNTSNEPEEINIENKYNIEIDTENYSLRIIDSGFVGEFYTEDNEHLKFNFRSNQKSIYPLTFEFNKTGDGGAVGKFKTFVENYIELSDVDIKLPTVNEFYKEYKGKVNLTEFYKEKINKITKSQDIQEFSNHFVDPKYTDEKLRTMEKDDKLFYILIVCLQFLEFLSDLYKIKNENGENEMFEFIKSCYLASKKITKYSLPYLLIK